MASIKEKFKIFSLLLTFSFINCKKEGSTRDIHIENNKTEKTNKSLEESIENGDKFKSFSVPKDYYIFDSCSVSYNKNTYKIISIEKIKNKDNKGEWYFGLPVIVLRKDKNQENEILRNDNLVYKFKDNCPADGYNAIVGKDKYFTIEQSSCLDFLFVNSYMTFKVNEKGDFLLHKYTEEYTDRSDPDKTIPSKTWTSKEFGNKKFEELNEDFFINLRNP